MAKISRKLYDSFIWPFRFVVLIWAITILQTLFPINFAFLGVYPGTISGLKGIFFMPIIHGDIGHVLSNTLPFFVLGTMILFFYRKIAWQAFLTIYLLSGFAVWLSGFVPLVFGNPGYHVGASGVIYGMAAFVFWIGIFRGNIKSIALALIVAFYYGSMIWGIFPSDPNISWQGHLLGAVAGILAALWFKDDLEEDEKPRKYSWEKEKPTLEDSYFLDRNVFEKTKRERAEEQRQRSQGNSGWYSNSSWD